MKAETRKQIIRWHMADLTIDEIAPIVPQYSKSEIKAVIDEHERKVRQERLMSGLRV
nr:MAG: hypothetical protein [Bacteriophage sp.]